MTFSSTAQGFEGSTPVATITTRMIRVLAVGAGILALSATAAQARPIGIAGGAQVATGAQGYHGFYRPAARTSFMTGSVDSPANQGTRMSSSVDPANDQSVPVVSAPVIVKTTDKSFDWTASVIGAAIAAAVLLLAGITASRIRPRRVAQL